MREPGFYWVKYIELDWVVCNWNGWKWLIPGLTFDDLEIIEIDERRIVRDEPIISNPNLRRGDFVTYLGGLETEYLNIGDGYRMTCPIWHGPKDDMIAVINEAKRRFVTKSKYFDVR